MTATEAGTEALLSLIAALTENTAALRENTAAHRGGGSGGGGGNRAVGGSVADLIADATSDHNAVFPNYGKAKGEAVRGAPIADLDYYGAGAVRSLTDPSKARFHDRERVLLASIEAERRRQAAPPPPVDPNAPPPPGDDDIPF